MIYLIDISATFSDTTNIASPKENREGRVSFLSALKGEEIKSTRTGVIHHSISGILHINSVNGYYY